MAAYLFRYWFEWGCSEESCPCLWSDDDVTVEEFGYCVDLHKLPISSDLIRFLCETGMEHDCALDWDYPPDPLLWTPEEEDRFYRKAREGYQRLQQELGEEYEIRYCEDR